MDAIFQWGLDFIIMIQQLDTPLLDSFFRAITSLGDELFYLLLFSFLLWCVDFYLGIRVGIIFLLSVYVNTGLKGIFQQPRPFDILPEIQKVHASGYGFPSGHAQSSIDTSFRGPIFLSIKPIFPLSVIGYMDQFWGTLVIYPDGISPSSGEKILK